MTDALIVIDMQRGLFAGPEGPPHHSEAVLHQICALIARARAARAPMFFIQHEGEPGDALEPGTPGFDLLPELAPRPLEPVIRKKHCSMFQRTGLITHITEHGVTRLVICGMATDYCVDTSVRSAFERGFEVTLASDGHTTHDNDHLTGEATIRHHNAVLANGGFAKVIPADKITFVTRLP
ncbi:MAG: cysteine hydrolase [Rhodospirillales bacterium]|nr:cysteine hydrolase [Rhodospirillales bacterium]